MTEFRRMMQSKAFWEGMAEGIVWGFSVALLILIGFALVAA